MARYQYFVVLLFLVSSVIPGAAKGLRSRLQSSNAIATDKEETRGKSMVSEQTAEAKKHDPQTDFDFFIGSWKVHNRKLKERLKGSNSWKSLMGLLLRVIYGEDAQTWTSTRPTARQGTSRE